MRNLNSTIFSLLLGSGSLAMLSLAVPLLAAPPTTHKAAAKNSSRKHVVTHAHSKKAVTAKSVRTNEAEERGKATKEKGHIPGRQIKMTDATKPPFVEKEGEDGKAEYEEKIKRLKMLHGTVNGEIDWKSEAIERQKALRVPAARIPMPGGSGAVGPKAALPPPNLSPTWTFTGPSSIAPPYRLYFGTLQAIGRIGAMAVDPNSPRTYYVGGATGGVWKSTDQGASWTPTTNAGANIAVSSIAIDPNNTNVIYVGSGDFDGFAASGSGVYKSIDGGQTWTALDPSGATFGTGSIRSILIDPSTKNPVNNQSNILLATTGATGNGAILRSTNSGLTWTSVLNPGNDVRTLVYNSNRTAIYAAVNGAGLYKSTNNGVSWTFINPNLIGPGAGRGNVDVAASRLDPGTVYVLDDGTQGVYKTTNGGTTFSRLAGANGLLSTQWGQSFYDFYIACSKSSVTKNTPTGPVTTTKDLVFVGLFSIFVSPDGGTSWIDSSNSYNASAIVHTDQHAIAFNPSNNNEILVGSDGGAYRMIYAPTVNTFSFTTINPGLGITQFEKGAVSPVDSNVLLGGTQDNSTPFANGGIFSWSNPGAGDGEGCAINPSDPYNANPTLRGPQNQYLSSQGNSIYVTENGWGSKLAIPIPTPSAPERTVFFTPLVLNDTNPLFAYTASNMYVYQYQHPALGAPNTNTSWTKFGQNFSLPIQTFAQGAPIAIGTASYRQQAIFVGTDVGSMWVSVDQGANFFQCDGGQVQGRTGVFGERTDYTDANGVFHPGAAGQPITNIVVSSYPQPNGNAVDGYTHKVWVTLGGNGGRQRVWTGTMTVFDIGNKIYSASWAPLPNTNLPNITPLTLVKLPHDDEQTMFLGNDLGVYMTTNGGATWTDAGAPLGLPRVTVNSLAFSSGTGALEAFTYGRGAWRLQAGNNVLMNIYPNLQEYRGDRSKLTATVELYVPGKNFLVETRSLKLTPSGYINTYISAQGSYDVRIRIKGFTSLFINSYNTNTTYITPLIHAGDVNGDNAIDGTDLTAVQAKLNQFWTGPEDVDGDGRVTAHDLALVQGNQGQVGQ